MAADIETGDAPVPHTEPMSNGEIARSLARIEKSLEGMGGKLDNRPSWEDVRRIEASLNGRIASLEDWQKWAHRIVIGAVLAALLALVIGVGVSPLL